MKKSFIFLIGMCFCLQFTKVQAQGDPFKCHYWLQDHSVNYTLSYPITDANNPNYKWLQAAAKHDAAGNANFKNTIAVFKMFNDYEINHSSSGREPIVFGKDGNGTYDPKVNFEVHSIAQSCYPDTTYILCGSMRSEDESNPTYGMVAVLNSNLDVMSLREYPDTKVFYSVYAQGENFYVCGETGNNSSIILQDNILTPGLNRVGYIDPGWVFHKIRIKAAPCQSDEFNISGIYTDDFGNVAIGYTTYQIVGNSFFYIDQVQVAINPPTSPTPHIIPNSRVTISNYPGQKDGLILAVSDGKAIYNFAFDRSPQPPILPTAYGFMIKDWYGILEDMDCGNYPNQQNPQLAWVGNRENPDGKPYLFADYISAHLASSSFPPIFPTHFADIIYFEPSIDDETAYYSLHKVHYSGGPRNPSGDSLFHAGGYYSGRDETFNPNRATFAVTPEAVKDKIDCAKNEEREIVEFEFTPIRCYQAVRVYPIVNTIDTYTHAFGFCTKGCTDALCGYPIDERSRENAKGSAKGFKKGKNK